MLVYRESIRQHLGDRRLVLLTVLLVVVAYQYRRATLGPERYGRCVLGHRRPPLCTGEVGFVKVNKPNLDAKLHKLISSEQTDNKAISQSLSLLARLVIFYNFSF